METYHWCRRIVSLTSQLGVITLIGLSCIGTTAEAASNKAQNGHWYDWFWPLGEHVPVEALKEEYVPFKGEGEIPYRPPLHLELGGDFLGTGILHPGFTVPILGAVWQPRIWNYFFNRTAIQSFDDGAVGRDRDTEISNRMDYYANLQLTNTEKIVLALRPTDNNSPTRFTRYTFEGTDEKFKNEFSADIETLFF